MKSTDCKKIKFFEPFTLFIEGSHSSFEVTMTIQAINEIKRVGSRYVVYDLITTVQGVHEIKNTKRYKR